MAHYKSDWDDLGRSIQEIVDRAVNSQDYQKLNQTIRQVVGKAVDAGSEAVRKVVDGGVHYPGQTGREEPEKKAVPVLYAGTGGRTAKSILKIIGGGILGGITFVGLLASVVLNLLLAGPGPSVLSAALGLAVLCGATALLCSGIGSLKKISRFKTYRKILGNKTHCPLDSLARGVGKNIKFVRRELRWMIDEGLFMEGHMDNEETQLITSHETYRYFEQSRLQLEQRQQQEDAEKAKKAASPHTAQDRKSVV